MKPNEEEKLIDKVIDPMLEKYFKQLKKKRKTIARGAGDGKATF